MATLTLAVEVVKKPATILDVGCGTGKLLRRVAIQWPEARLIGVDPAKGMIDVAKRLNPKATFYLGIAESLPLPDNFVDLALSTMSFHHWSDQVAGLRDIARVLRPGGYFVLVDASLPSWLVRIFRVERFHSDIHIQALFDRAGLKVHAQKKITWRGTLGTIGSKPLREDTVFNANYEAKPYAPNALAMQRDSHGFIMLFARNVRRKKIAVISDQSDRVGKVTVKVSGDCYFER